MLNQGFNGSLQSCIEKEPEVLLSKKYFLHAFVAKIALRTYRGTSSYKLEIINLLRD